MANKIDKVELLLSKLDKKQLADFIRKEYAGDRQLQDRFLSLGAGTLFRPDPKAYADRVKRLIGKYSDRYGFIEYLYKTEIIKLYTNAVRRFFGRAGDRNSYHEGVGLLRNLIKYGGRQTRLSPSRNHVFRAAPPSSTSYPNCNLFLCCL